MPAIPARTATVTIGSVDAIQFVKDPDEVLDFTLDWSSRLNDTELITESVWLKIFTDMTLDNNQANRISGHFTTIWVSGGKDGRNYIITNRITTNGGRVFDQTFTIVVKAN